MSHTDERRGYVEVTLSLLSAAEGGRGTAVRSGYMPNWWLPGTPERVLASGAIELSEVDELVPGSTAMARVYPFLLADWDAVAVGDGLDVAEGPNRTVGRAVVTRIVLDPVPVEPAGLRSS